MKIRALIVDDEKNGRENLSGILREYCPEVTVVGEADSVETAKSIIQEKNPSLVFLDIEMPKANGFKLLEYFQDFNFEVIFVTAYDSYAIQAIRFSAADYILKPINIYDLKKAVEKAIARIRLKEENQLLKQLYYNLQRPANPRIGLPTAEKIEFVDVDSIIRCEGEGNYSHLYFTNGRHLLVAKTLVEFEELLNDYNFIRVHKTHLINLKQVSAFLKTEGGSLQLSDGKTIPVSRRRKEFVLEKLKSN
ncbi:MAG: response regulator transcription factor [Prolixibacteraceae bacterium]|nr:response regulator transcription factor [Prolixibacteraceae bacterium]